MRTFDERGHEAGANQGEEAQMNKRQFLRLEYQDRDIELRRAARAVDGALNLWGRETIDELIQAAHEGAGADERLIAQVSKVSSPDFPASFVRAAQPACNTYLRYARYWRAAAERD